MSMTPWTMCVLSTLVGGLLSVGVAALCMARMGTATVSRLVSYAVGALLAAALLDVLPEAIHESGSAQTTSATVLIGLLGFFVLEKLVIWRHDHRTHGDTSPPQPVTGHSHHAPHGRSGLMVIVGDSFHNFVDGILVASAFQQSSSLGLVTAAAIIAHEIPQELGDFVVLLHSGYSRAQAFAFNLLSSLAMTVGAVLAYAALPLIDGAVPVCLALATASMVYVAVADLIPTLHRHSRLHDTAQQLLLIGAGIASVAGAHHWVASWGLH